MILTKHVRRSTYLGIASLLLACSSSQPATPSTAHPESEVYQDALTYLASADTKLPEEVDSAKKSIFRIFVEKGNKVSQGTAFLYGESNLILTAAHVVEAGLPGEEVKMILIGGDGKTYWDSTKTKNKSVVEFPGITPLSGKGDAALETIFGPLGSYAIDFAMIRLESHLHQKPLTLASRRPSAGDTVYALGSSANPLQSWEAEESSLHVTKGSVLPLEIWEASQNHTETFAKIKQSLEEKGPFISHSASIEQGDSGGPLLNSSGELVGVNVSMSFTLSDPTKTQALFYSIDAFHWIPYIVSRMKEPQN